MSSSSTSPSSKKLDEICRRHSRLQAPTISLSKLQTAQPRRLPLRATGTPSWVPSITNTRERAKPSAALTVAKAWKDFNKLGDLLQGRSKYTVCSYAEQKNKLVMFKRVSQAACRTPLPPLHPNILSVEFTITEGDSTYFGYEFAKCTLAEILSVNTPLDEPQIQIIGRSVGSPLAPRYLGSRLILIRYSTR
jgi:hypothetical protein